ncbi:Hypothetical protein ADU72_2338 (plasmid) [Pediococcus damnosus]|uniref:Uncharacterized protein n=1 Tax=Pediococcus damnosus TaxID=51663 RepID=A0ABM6A7W3_9LACO|nr:Hypothetical protein ADU72_2338 [Pediococcus damnosus]
MVAQIHPRYRHHRDPANANQYSNQLGFLILNVRQHPVQND